MAVAPLLRWSLLRICSDAVDLDPVGEAEDEDDAARLVESLQPDVVIVGCTSAEGDGWQLARELRDRHDALGIVVLAATGSDDLLFRALDNGASAFLAQDATVPEILAALRHAAVAASSFSATGLARAMRRQRDRRERVTLSPRELQVLWLLREGKSVPEVAATIYVSLSTAKTYVARIYEKLGANNRAQALMIAVESGLFDEARAAAAR